MELAIATVRKRVSSVVKSDPLLRDVAHSKIAFTALETQTGSRVLTSDEVRALELLGNWASDWSMVRVSDNVQGRFPVERIRGCSFHGPVVIGDLVGEVSFPGAWQCLQPCGLYNSTLSWCVVGDGALVKDCNTVCRCIVAPGAALMGCGVVSRSDATGREEGSRFANGLTIEVGPETRGRALACYATMNLAEAASAAMDRASPEAVAEHKTTVEEYASMVSCPATVIGEGARVLMCPRVVDAFVGPYALVESCDLVRVTLLSTAEEPSSVTSGSILRSALVQEGVTVDRGSIVSDSLLMEHSHVTNRGQVTHSVLGPDSGVGSGECLHSLLGPFVGFHHQSLLIATIWPLGRGNVAYGANVGSNHTSRQADQEMWPGEGVFFGLSTVIKFPGNYSESPFSVIAAGVTCLPQRVAFPFSLVNSQEQGGLDSVPPGLNHLRPGWVLAESMFMVIRNDDKYRRRARARRNRVDWSVFRPSVMKLVANARSRLVAAASSGTKEIYVGDREVSGLGKNYMTEASRLAGIATYTLHLRRYALRGLLARLEADLSADLMTAGSLGDPVRREGGRLAPPSDNAVDIARLLTSRSGCSPDLEGSTGTGEGDGGGEDWEFQRSFLMAEFDEGDREPGALLSLLISIETEVARDVARSKAKDDKRGAQVIPGYADAHTPAHEEAAVKLAKSIQGEVERRAHTMMSRI